MSGREGQARSFERLTQLCALPRRFQEQLEFEKDQCHVDSMATQAFRAKEESGGSFELGCQEQYLEVKEGLLIHGKMRFA